MKYCVFHSNIETSPEWTCSHCPFRTSGSAIQRAVAVIQSEIDVVDAIRPPLSQDRLQQCEQLFRKYRSVLHGQHYLMTSMRESLIQMYGRVTGYTLPELPDIILKHKIDLCRKLMHILDVVHPGKTRARALLMYELHAPIVRCAQSAHCAGLITVDQWRQDMTEALQMAVICADILAAEDPSSAEWTIGELAAAAAAQIRLTLDGIL